MVGQCKDKNCPVHGNIRLRGRTIIGKVTSARRDKTCTVEWVERKYIPKYERSGKNICRIHAHLPECLNIKTGDQVVARESRPLSKTKHFVITGKVKKKPAGRKQSSQAKKPKSTRKKTKK